jgi:prepilin-type processing-associated H-X9-DG protein
VLPPGSINPTGPIANKPPGYHHNWISQILPFLEYRNVSRHMNFNVGVYDPANMSVRAVQLNSLVCPSDGRFGFGPSMTLANTPVPSSPSSYAGVHHDFEAPIDTTNHGVFFLNSRVRYEEIGDGSAQTIFIGEHPIAPGDLGWASGTKATLRNTGELINQTRPNFFPVNPLPTTPPPPSDPLNDTGADGPSAKPKKKGGPVGNPEKPADPVGGFGSFHPGGANFAFGDGSVRFLKSTLNPEVFQLLANRNDGEMISGDKY